MARQNRVVIKHPTLGYYSQCKSGGKVDRIEQDGTGSKFVHARDLLVPIFDTVSQATPFGDVASAEAMMKHADLLDPNAFAGCIVEPEAE